ncbi:alpha-tocopherol transfer protein-like [Wyeomyia smithii]|uniref:alpha-tocopherol transfer protein-like n=1 Tax=Wyeomyia smithii TaxID=174621 RepID=UPI002467B159|nr:alpha-tocopherol transfer protein-like [Wyeomyia smithii]
MQANNSNEPDNVGTLMEWISSQPHLPKITEKDVKKFLHCNYDDVDGAKKTIENYYTFRTRCTDFFLSRDINEQTIQTAMNLMMFAVLPKPSPEGYRIAFCRLIDSDTTNYVYLHATKFLVMCLDLWMEEECFAPGHIIIIDMEGMHLGHMAKMKISVMKNYTYYTQEALPIRIKQLHFLNVVPFMDKLMFLMRPFLQQKILDAVNFHTTLESIFKSIPLECLPCQYGGEAGNLENLRRNYNLKLVKNRNKFIEEEAKYLVDETKRIPAPRRFMFGLFHRKA